MIKLRKDISIILRALACIWLIHDGNIKFPHIKGDTGNSSYVPLYTNYIPTEFLINGIVSALLTVVNVICIFITAIIVLKIKEVAAPYTSSPDLRRYEKRKKKNGKYFFLLLRLTLHEIFMDDNFSCCNAGEEYQRKGSSYHRQNIYVFFFFCNLQNCQVIYYV